MIEANVINFAAIGNEKIGSISIYENKTDELFSIQRVFWAYGIPNGTLRGKHAHYKTKQILIAVHGKIEVSLEDGGGNTKKVLLQKPFEGLYIPPQYWHTMVYHNNAVQLVLASEAYDENDYIRDYQVFKKYYSALDLRK